MNELEQTKELGFLVPAVKMNGGEVLMPLETASLPPADALTHRDQMVSDIIWAQNELDEQTQTNAELRQKLIEATVVKRAVDELDLDVEKSKVDVKATLESFIRMFVSEDTRTSYRLTIGRFFKHMQTSGIDVFQLDRGFVQNYKDSLYRKYSSASAKQKLGCLQGWWRKGMMRDYPKVFTLNHFADMRYEPVVPKHKKDAITDTMFKRICIQLVDDGRIDVLSVVKFLERTGERVGIFKNLVITNKRTFAYSATSKGSVRSGNFTKEEFRSLKQYGIIDPKNNGDQVESLNFVQHAFKRAGKKLFDKNKIECIPSVHDLRRRRIALEYLAAKNQLESVAVSRRFHKSVQTTVSYIESVTDVKWRS